MEVHDAPCFSADDPRNASEDWMVALEFLFAPPALGSRQIQSDPLHAPRGRGRYRVFSRWRRVQFLQFADPPFVLPRRFAREPARDFRGYLPSVKFNEARRFRSIATTMRDRVRPQSH